MGTIGNEALENIRNEMKGFDMASNIVNLNIDIPADKKDVITAFQGLINAFRSDIKVKEVESTQEVKSNNITYEKAQKDFFGKYVGSLKISDNAEKEYNQHRVAKYGK